MRTARSSLCCMAWRGVRGSQGADEAVREEELEAREQQQVRDRARRGGARLGLDELAHRVGVDVLRRADEVELVLVEEVLRQLLGRLVLVVKVPDGGRGARLLAPQELVRFRVLGGAIAHLLDLPVWQAAGNR